MQTRIVLSTGTEFVTDVDADAVMTQMLAAESYAKVQVPDSKGTRTVYVLREHIVSIEEVRRGKGPRPI